MDVLAKKILRARYSWMTMESDCSKYVQRCHQCQIHGDLIKVPPSELNAMSSPWLFVAWGMGVIGPIKPTASNVYGFILVAIGYFTKWVEATSHKSVTKKVVVDFMRNHIICRFVQDHSPKFDSLPAANERNRRSSQQKYQEDIEEMVDIHKVIPAEAEIPSLRIIQEAELDNAEWVRARYEQLALIDEKRMVVVCHGQLYRQRMARAFNKRVRTRIFPHQDEYKGKFAPNWQGPYMVRKVLSRGAVVLAEMDGQEWPKPINSDTIKRYYA
ncbi:uncharacterized protein LOC132032062 [Lycium ferocissimum]|uniref:uncharacterized protein LOC132032062 n=1 Tax=Lycium ferocissimum TaxID=112874 RepID=UPI0028164420|nr:uncharacterized protein LOC132032062 [Lycium ferocissimum]